MKDFPVSLIKTVRDRFLFFLNNLTESENDENVSPLSVPRGLCSLHPWSFLGPS